MRDRKDGIEVLTTAATDVDRGGRPAITSAHDLAAAAQRLFLRKGFEQTSVEDIAIEAGVSRRTFFRYFSTKADVVWVESESELAVFRDLLASSSPATDAAECVANAFISALDHGRAEDDWARHRAQLILETPAVQTHAGVVYRQWRLEIAEFVAERTGLPMSAEYPTAVAYATLAASAAGHQVWIARPDRTFVECLQSMFALMMPRLT